MNTFASSEGTPWVSDRDIVSTPNETARGNISSNLSRVIVEGGIYRHLYYYMI